MRISDWSSDVCSSELGKTTAAVAAFTFDELMDLVHSIDPAYRAASTCRFMFNDSTLLSMRKLKDGDGNYLWQPADGRTGAPATVLRSEEHTSELQSLMRISYAVFCLKKKKQRDRAHYVN